MKKTIFGILAAVSLIGGAATVAEAKTNFSIYLGVPYYDQQIGPDYRYQPNRGWYQDRNYYSGNARRNMSCNQARNIVRQKGYRNVIARDCEGRTYTFSTRRNNQRVLIYVNARTGATWRG